ncbi:aldose epimerase [Acidipropionibacterium thoenii]|uniref:aldose epimerase family protein n=1 Tax=Acidipropionibacterium thoenii TaxID=1751 RepID=UPI0009FEB81F|nr:aldose epimerase [Acidipropionibacterium thoenii]
MDSMAESVTDAVHPTGRQHEITSGGYRAVICEQGATLRSLTFDGEDLLLSFGAEESPEGARGQHLLPWPNRIRDGRYLFDGDLRQLAINEQNHHNAIHGLTRWLAWNLAELTTDSITQSLLLLDQPGWPGSVRFTLSHHLSLEGLRVEVSALNVGATPVPLGYAAHPYLVMAGIPIDQWSVSAGFATYLEVDERLLPVALRPVEGTPAQLHGEQEFGSRSLDTAFTDSPVAGRRWQVEVRAGRHHRLLWAGPGLPWSQIFTPWYRTAMAVEPMSCGPDAFNEGPTHDSMLRLEPGDSAHFEWGVSI